MKPLNADQQSAMDIIVPLVLDAKSRGITLVGEGGTGKTFLVIRIVEKLKESGLKVLFAAPTNKAVKQLEKAALEYGLNLDNVAFQTVHSALGLALLPNEDQKFASRVGKGVFEIFDVVVIDECSMLSKRVMYSHLLPECWETGTKLLLMGDDLQLPPPKETLSPSFTEFDIVRLTRVMRQGEGSHILTVTGALRTALMNAQPFRYLAAPEDVEEVVEIKAAEFLRTVVSHFDENTNLDEQRVLAWRNRRVAEINRAIRRKIYGTQVGAFELGERVVTGAPIKDEEGNIVLGTDEECTVHQVEPNSWVTDEDSGEDFRTIQLALRPLYAPVGQVFAQVLHESETERYYNRLNELARDAKSSGSSRQLWAKFWRFKELFNDVRYCYCITVHRSQGSTFSTAFVDVKDILGNTIRGERQRLLNVAFSRPRHRLIVNKAKYVA